MSNYVLAFKFNSNNDNGFNEVLDTFAQHEYITQCIDISPSDKFQIDKLPMFTERLRRENQIDRLVVLSNCRQALFSWYRCYNDLIDDFVYIIDDDINILKLDEYRDFFVELYNFTAIDLDEIQGQIYLNINIHNSNLIFQFLLKNCNFRFFNDLTQFPYEIKPRKNKMNKSYLFKNQVFTLDPYIDFDKKETIIGIDSIGQQPTEVKLQQDLVVKHSYFFIYLADELFNQRNKELDGFIAGCSYLLRYDKSKESIFNNIIEYFTVETDFTKRLYFLTLAIGLQVESVMLSRQTMQLLLNDNQHLHYHYAIIYNFSYYAARDNLKFHDQYYNDLRNAVQKLSLSFCSHMSINGSMRKDNHIAIHVDQLMGLLHSPTKLILDYAIALKRYNPYYVIKIFVEDNYYLNPEEYCISYYYISEKSSDNSLQHIQYLLETDIEIYYSDTNKNKKDRTIEIVNEINDFNPDIIWTSSSISIAIEWLYRNFPILYMDLAGTYTSGYADLYLYYNKDEILQKNKTYTLIDNNKIKEYKVGFDFPAPKAPKFRKDYGLNENHFIMVTVGNRLDADMNNDFMDEICSFLIKHDKAVWFLVGEAEIPYLHTKYSNIINNNQIVLIDFERDLVSLYKICDVYINPVRSGGGISVAWAMHESIPILTLNHPADGAINLVGHENGIGDTIDCFNPMLEKYYNDSNFKKLTGNLMRENIENFSLKASVLQFAEFFQITREYFNRRVMDS